MSRPLALLALSLAACHYAPSPETLFRAKVPPMDVDVQGGLARGSHVRMGALDLEVLDAVASRTDDELVSATVRGALEDAAVAAAAGGVVAKAANARDTASAADRTSQALALVSLLGSLSAASDERSELVLRAKADDRVYRATCTSSEHRELLEPDAKSSLSCAIVAAIDRPAHHWALAIRTSTSGFKRPRHEGYLEARTAKGRDESAPLFRIYTTSQWASAIGAGGKEERFTQFNASFELVAGQTHVASVVPRTYGAKPRVWLDASGVADREARDAVAIASAILELHRWPQVDDRRE